MPHIVRQQGLLAGTRIAVFLALVHTVNDVLTGMLGALLPTLQERFAASTTVLAMLVAAFSISSSVTQPLMGALADRFGLRQVAGAGVALTAVSLSLIGVAGSVPLLVTLLVFGGIGSAALHPVSTSIVGGPSSKSPGLAVGLFTAGGMAGFAAGPVLPVRHAGRYRGLAQFDAGLAHHFAQPRHGRFERLAHFRLGCREGGFGMIVRYAQDHLQRPQIGRIERERGALLAAGDHPVERLL